MFYSLYLTFHSARKDLKENKPAHFKGFLAFLCEVFSVMRTTTNEVFKPLMPAIFDCFNMVLGKETTDDADSDGLDFGELGNIDEDACDVVALQVCIQSTMCDLGVFSFFFFNGCYSGTIRYTIIFIIFYILIILVATRWPSDYALLFKSKMNRFVLHVSISIYFALGNKVNRLLFKWKMSWFLKLKQYNDINFVEVASW